MEQLSKLKERTPVIGAAVAVTGAALVVGLLRKMSSRVRKRTDRVGSTVAYYAGRAMHRVHSAVSSRAPPMPGSTHMSAEWLTLQLRGTASLGARCRVSAATVGNELTGGFHGGGSMKRVAVEYEGEGAGPATVMLKTCWEGLERHLQCVHHGLAREALCYGWLGAQPYLPVVHYSRGSMASGSYTLVMEDLKDATLATAYFGNQWRGVPEPLPFAVEPKQVLMDAFTRVAAFHAAHWAEKPGALAVRPWMRGADWYRGSGRDAWHENVAWARNNWETGKAALLAADSAVKFSPKVAAALEESFEWSTWAQARKHFDACPTFTHGDFHGQNVFMRHRASDRAVLIDWAMVGPGLPLQDVGQFMVSDVPPALRRDVEEDVVKAYWARLIALGVDADAFPFAACWAQYQRATVGKWLWMLALLSNFGLTPVMMQYFHDQVLAFLDDHAGDDLRFFVGV